MVHASNSPYVTPEIVEAVQKASNETLACVAIVDTWLTSKALDPGKPRWPTDFSAAAIAEELGVSDRELKGVLDLKRWEFRGYNEAGLYLRRVTSGKIRAYSALTAFLRDKGKTTGVGAMKPRIVNLREMFMRLLPDDPSNYCTHRALQLGIGATDDDYQETKESLVRDGLISVKRGRGGRISRTPKSLRDGSPYCPSKPSAPQSIAPERSEPPPKSPIISPRMVHQGHDATGLPPIDIVYSYNLTYMGFLESLISRELDRSAREVLQFVRDRVVQINNKLLDYTAERDVQE